MDSAFRAAPHDCDRFDRTGRLSVGLLFNEESVIRSDVRLAIDGVVFVQQRRPSLQPRRCGPKPRGHHFRRLKHFGHNSGNTLRTTHCRVSHSISRPMVSGLRFGRFDELRGRSHLRESELCQSDYLKLKSHP